MNKYIDSIIHWFQRPKVTDWKSGIKLVLLWPKLKYVRFVWLKYWQVRSNYQLTKPFFMSLLSTTCNFNLILLQKQTNKHLVYLFKYIHYTEQTYWISPWLELETECSVYKESMLNVRSWLREPSGPRRLISTHVCPDVLLACSLKRRTHQQTCVLCERFTTERRNLL